MINRYVKKQKPIFNSGGAIEAIEPQKEIIKNIPLSQSSDPRVKKLKKELEKLSIVKPKYIKLFS